MTRSRRESKIIAAVSCPECGREHGRACWMADGRPHVHPARKAAWQAQDRTPDFVLVADRTDGQLAPYMLVAPQTPEARDWLAMMTTYQIVAGAARVPHADMPALTQRIIAAGWRTGETI